MNLTQISFNNAKGEPCTLSDFKAKAYLIVNVASKCGLTPQYEGLQNLYEQHKDKGLEILAFPANEFLGQEPGSNEEIQNFCSLTYNVTFPVNQKIVVKGEGQHPLYKELTQRMPKATQEKGSQFKDKLQSNGLVTGEDHDILWNFEKFLLNEKGEVIERFAPDVSPESELITQKLRKVLE